MEVESYYGVRFGWFVETLRKTLGNLGPGELTIQNKVSKTLRM